ncbi:LacI family transcriptional regulator [Roseburia sp. AF15-21]|uniref:substrate-binding domain-containing protein n=1 Tax=Roseburia sp. AF15-21 TaxID=2293128 RepID=UPI000E47906E|nr:substrate-binding domain-containing protein [Roseburia sp. AF15-21]RHR89626.1 LacI family transcriptional regulator [Roseburia sp. AF15-21]
MFFRRIAARALEYLISLGHRKIGYVGDCHNESRYKGYQETLFHHNIEMDIQYVIETEHPEAICHVEAVLNLLQVFTNDETYVKIEKTVAERAKAGEVITMCTFAEEMTNKGIEIGEAQGIRIGEARGIAREKISVARNLLDLLTDDVIAEKVGLELATVKELREETK